MFWEATHTHKMQLVSLQHFDLLQWSETAPAMSLRYLQLNLYALFRSSSGHFNPHFWRERGRMLYLTSHSLADLGLWTLSLEFCPLPRPCLWDRVSGCWRKVAKVKKQHLISYCHLHSSRTAQRNEYWNNPTLSRFLLLRIAFGIGRQGSLSLCNLQTLIHLTLIRILPCDRHCALSCRRHDLTEIRYLTPGSHCLLGNMSEVWRLWLLSASQLQWDG